MIQEALQLQSTTVFQVFHEMFCPSWNRDLSFIASSFCICWKSISIQLLGLDFRTSRRLRRFYVTHQKERSKADQDEAKMIIESRRRYNVFFDNRRMTFYY